ncbi:TolC family protein [Parapedobacter koreensis]|uniref:Outer membrane protein TolC n=1 Tax=Parapedobacter koreensis TaxID=332977 RepID=A0A1H7U289_9SPHI|nr:TolC family protein [Parapedobacter koreensis]SEL91101.1 Outer membrane protein TolC [Parapedobacter koreensis]
MIKYVVILFCCWLLAMQQSLQAQTPSLTLQESHALAIANYPMIKQHDLIAKSAQYAIEQAHTGYLPQININGQATYQSAVTQIPLQIPGIDVPSLSKDQYKLFGEVNQRLYDGGSIRLQKEAIEANAAVEEQALEVQLHDLKQRINQLFFGVLLLDAQLAQNDLLQKDLTTGLAKARAAIANGSALKSSADLLEAELLKAKQQTAELQASRKAYIQVLGLFINRSLNEHTVLQQPEDISPNPDINRPELDWYASRQQGLGIEGKMLTAKNLPMVGLFLQGGVGRPALNMLSNNMEAYYYGGVRLSIPISGFYTLRKERALLGMRHKTIDVQRETFLFNTDLAVRQQTTELQKYEQLLATDDTIIALRTSVKNAALAQLENGVINTADYLREVNAEDTAKVAKIRHEIQRLMTLYAIQHTTGNE